MAQPVVAVNETLVPGPVSQRAERVRLCALELECETAATAVMS